MKNFIKVCLSICSLIYLLSSMLLTPSRDYDIEALDDYFVNKRNRVAMPIEPIPEIMPYRQHKGGYKRSPFDINNLSSQTKTVVSNNQMLKEVSLLVGDVIKDDTFTQKDSYSIESKYATEYKVLRNVIINRAFEKFKKKEIKQNKSINTQYYADILVIKNTQQIAVVFKTEITDSKKLTDKTFKDVYTIRYSKKSTDKIFHELISELSDTLEINYNQVKKNSISNNLLTIMFPKKFNNFTKKSHKYGIGSKRTFSLRVLESSSLEHANQKKKKLLSKGYNSFIRVTRNRQPYKGYEGPIYLLLLGSFDNKRAARSYKLELRLKHPNDYFIGTSKVVSTKQVSPPFEYTTSPDIFFLIRNQEEPINLFKHTH